MDVRKDAEERKGKEEQLDICDTAVSCEGARAGHSLVMQ